MKLLPIVIAAIISLVILIVVFTSYVAMGFWKLDKVTYPKTYAWQLKVTMGALVIVIATFILVMVDVFLKHG